MMFQKNDSIISSVPKIIFLIFYLLFFKHIFVSPKFQFCINLDYLGSSSRTYCRHIIFEMVYSASTIVLIIYVSDIMYNIEKKIFYIYKFVVYIENFICQNNNCNSAHGRSYSTEMSQQRHDCIVNVSYFDLNTNTKAKSSF